MEGVDVVTEDDEPCDCPEREGVDAVLEAHLSLALALAVEVRWSEDGEWVATTAKYPSLSWLAGTPGEAQAGLLRLVRQEEVLYDGA